MSNEIATGKRVLFRAAPEDASLTPGIVQAIDGLMAEILADGQVFTCPVSLVKLGTQDTDSAAWMLFDGVISIPEVHRDGCYICEDPEFAQMGLPLCRPCPACVSRGAGKGHIAADETACDDCGYDDIPGQDPG